MLSHEKEKMEFFYLISDEDRTAPLKASFFRGLSLSASVDPGNRVRREDQEWRENVGSYEVAVDY